MKCFFEIDFVIFLYVSQSLLDIGNDILFVLDTCRETDQIRIGFSPLGVEIGNNEAPVRLVDVELVMIADDLSRIEGSQFLLVFFPVCQLFLDGCYAGSLSSGKPRREFRCAVLTHISVIQFAVAQKLDFLAADVACFFIK